MDFETFKRHQEQFSSISTPRELEFCRSNYNHYLQKIEYDTYFQQFEMEAYVQGEKGSYEQYLFSLLGFDILEDKQIAIVIQPSFQPESILRLQCVETGMLLNYTELQGSLWAQLRDGKDDGADPNNNVNKYERQTSGVAGAIIYSNLETAVRNAKVVEDKWITLDGTGYYISMILDGKRHNVTKVSPNEDSIAGKLMRVIEKVLGYVKAAEVTEEELVKRIDLIYINE